MGRRRGRAGPAISFHARAQAGWREGNGQQQFAIGELRDFFGDLERRKTVAGDQGIQWGDRIDGDHGWRKADWRLRFRGSITGQVGSGKKEMTVLKNPER
jgi:hypothetical protein